MCHSQPTTGRRKFPSPAHVRSTDHRRLSRRRLHPSCSGGFTRFFLWGQSRSRPRLARRLRHGSEAQAFSSIARWGFFRRCPGPSRGTATVSRVGSRRVTSAGDTDAKRVPTGTPWPSATAIHFAPLPRVVFPTQAPCFRRGNAPVEGFGPIQSALGVQVGSKGPPGLEPHVLRFPIPAHSGYAIEWSVGGP
jgi:hypothetical protein